MRARLTGFFAVLAVMACCAGVGIALGATETPLSERIAASGYDTSDLRVAHCSISYSGLPACGPGNNEGNSAVTSYVYRPWPDNTCLYWFDATGFGPFFTGSWEARIEWDPNELDRASSFPLGATGFKGKVDKTKPVSFTIDEPTPEELWAFANLHLQDPDERCKPTGVA